MKFTHKVTARNLIRYKKRFFMTVIGIAGCTALLLTGFGLRDSIGDIVGKQFGELYQYNLTASFKDEDAPRADETVKAVLEDKSRVTDYLMTYQESGDLYAGNKTTEATLYVPESTSRLPDFIVMRERKSGKAVPFDGSGVLLTEKQAEALGVKAGDTLRVRNADGKSGEFRLAGIIENYVQGALYIPRELYEAAFGAPAFTTLIGRTAGNTQADRDAVSAALLKSDQVQSAMFTDDIKGSFADMVSNIDYIVIVLIDQPGNGSQTPGIRLAVRDVGRQRLEKGGRCECLQEDMLLKLVSNPIVPIRLKPCGSTARIICLCSRICLFSPCLPFCPSWWRCA